MLQITETLLTNSPIQNKPTSGQKPTRTIRTMPFFKFIGNFVLRQARAHSKNSAPQQDNPPATPANLESQPKESASQDFLDLPGPQCQEPDPNELHLPASPQNPSISLQSEYFTPPTDIPEPMPAPTIPFQNGYLHPGSYIFTDLATTGTKGKGKTVLPPTCPRSNPNPTWPVCRAKDCPVDYAHEAGPYNFEAVGGNTGLPMPPDVVQKAMLDVTLRYELERNGPFVKQFKMVHSWPDC